ncbi:MAG: nucleotidyltransferase domain-containing protein [Spirochaetia bacterium]|nr:nucleotidyltransferase domain-containing protein [Spirochaetia bacterium]
MKKLNREEILLILKDLRPSFSEKYGITKLGIFGSIARNQASETSDIDIVYEIKKPSLFTAVHIKEELENKFNVHVDIVRYREKMNPYLKQRIDVESIYV